MSIRKTAGVLLTFGLAASVVQADIVVTLRAVDGGGNEIVDPVPAGTEVFVDVLLSSSGVDNPLFNLRSLQFDFTDTGAGIVLSDFEWRLQDTGILSDALYFKDTTLFPGRVSADYANLEQDDDGDGDIDDDVDPRFIVALDGDPVRVARMTATVNDSDTIDATRRDTGDPNRTDQGVRFLARFTSPKTFRLPLGNVKGGALTIAVEGGGGGGGGAVLTQLAITPPSFEIEVGGTQQLVVTGTFSDGSVRDLTAASTGTTYTQAGDVVTVTADGLVTGAAEGAGTVTATNGAVSASTSATVSEAPPEVTLEDLIVNPDAFTITSANGRVQLRVLGVFSNNARRDLTLAASGTTYNVDTDGIVTISVDGLVTPISDGQATITIENDGVTEIAVATVALADEPGECEDDIVVLDSVRFAVDNLTIDEDEDIQLVLLGVNCDGSIVENLQSSDESSFTSSDESVATVLNNGVLSGVSEGEADITATFRGFTATLHVIVLPVDEPPGQGNDNDNENDNTNGNENDNEGGDGGNGGCRGGAPCGTLGFVEALWLGLGWYGLRRRRFRA